MGRTCRLVPSDWIHPTDSEGHFIPLFDGRDLMRKQQYWDLASDMWDQGYYDDEYGDWSWKPKLKHHYGSYENYAGKRPDYKDYMSNTVPQFNTHYQMYETTSEGTPISPVMDHPAKLARWLADNNMPMFATFCATYDQWTKSIAFDIT